MRYLKTIVIAISMLFSGVALSSCGSDEPDVTPTVYVSAGALTHIEINPWGSVVANALVFNSTGDWGAEVRAANSSYEILENQDADWLEVLPFQGGPGEIRASLYAIPNNGEDDRYAVVVVSSPTNSISFQVVQHARTTGDGDGLKPNPGED